LQREVRIQQSITLADVSEKVFEVDTSGLPQEWIIHQKGESTRYGDVSVVRLAAGRKIKVVLAPVDPLPPKGVMKSLP
jgi:hypothetical protein